MRSKHVIGPSFILTLVRLECGWESLFRPSVTFNAGNFIGVKAMNLKFDDFS